MMSRRKDEATQKLEEQYKDLVDLRKHFDPKNLSVWKVDSGMSSLVNKLIENLASDDYVRFKLNEPVEALEFNKRSGDSNQIQIKSSNSVENFDMVISSVYSKCKSLVKG